MEKHTLTYSLCCWMFLTVCLTVAQEIRVEVGMTENKVHVGDNVTFTCRVQGIQDGTFPSIFIGKQIIVDPEHTELFEISNNKYLYDDYKKTKRYFLRDYAEGDATNFFLDIYNVQYEDTSRIGCYVADTEAMGITSLEVYKPVDSIMFNNHTNGSTVHLQENEKLPLTCYVNGAVPAPNVHVMVGDHDYTEQFRHTQEVELLCKESDNCLPHYQFNKRVYHDTFVPKTEDHGQKLTCNASVPGSKFATAETHIFLNISFSPKFDCQSEQKVKLHSLDYELKCQIRGNPELEEPNWHFYWGGDEKNLQDGDSMDDGNMMVHKLIYENGTVESILHIKEVSARHFLTYRLDAQNSLGWDSRDIKLTEDDANPSTGHQSSILDITLLFVAVFCSIMALKQS